MPKKLFQKTEQSENEFENENESVDEVKTREVEEIKVADQSKKVETRGRKKKDKNELANKEIVVYDPPKNQDGKPEYISYTKAQKLVNKDKPKRERTEAQKAVWNKLLEANKKKREDALKAKEQEEKIKEMEKHKKVYIVKPKRPKAVKQSKPISIPKNHIKVKRDESRDDDNMYPEDEDEEDEETDVVPVMKRKYVRKPKQELRMEQEVSDSTDTREIKKKIKKVEMINETITKVKQPEPLGLKFF